MNILGIFCRFGALAVAAGLIGVTCWAGLHATAQIGVDIRADLQGVDVPPENGAKHPTVGLLLNVNRPRYTQAFVVSRTPERKIFVAKCTNQVFHTPRRYFLAGRCEYEIRGIPYGPLAFKRRRIIIDNPED